MPQLWKRKPVITDPAAHAAQKYRRPFRVKRVLDRWKPWRQARTTAEFQNLDAGYVRHCGPVAVTNIALTLLKRENAMGGRTAAEVFSEVVRIGAKTGIYRNADFLGLFGGTFNILAGIYLRACFQALHIPAKVQMHVPVKAEDYLRSLKRGGILYLVLSHHPVYGSHHLACYGAVEVESADGIGTPVRKIYLLVADGWSNEVRYLDTAGLVLDFYYEVSLKELTEN